MKGYKLELSLFSKEKNCIVLTSTSYHLTKISMRNEIKRFKGEWLKPCYLVFMDKKGIEINVY